MKRFTGAIQKSVDAENWYAALFMALTLPDICACLSSDNNKTNGNKYAAWFNSFMGGKYSYFHPVVGERIEFMTGDSCYALRCAMLHQGEADLTSQKVKSIVTSIHFTTTSGHCNYINGVLQLDVATFCSDMCESVSTWFEGFQAEVTSPDKISSLLTVYVSESSIFGGAVTFGSGKKSPS